MDKESKKRFFPNEKTENFPESKPESVFRSRRKGISGAWLAAFLLSFGLALAACISCNNGLTASNSAPADGDVTQDASGGPPPAANYDGAKTSFKVKFEVKNGGTLGLSRSYGIVSAQDDSFLVYDSAVCANDFIIKIDLPVFDSEHHLKKYEYLNIRWKGHDLSLGVSTYVKAKLELRENRDYYIITVDYNGHGKVATKNLYDVRVEDSSVSSRLAVDFEKAKERAVNN